MDNQLKNFMEIMKYCVSKEMQGELPRLYEPVDWGFLKELSERQNLFLFFHEVACKYPEYRQQPGYNDNAIWALLMMGQQVKKTEMFLDLYREFLKEDLHPIVMKGIVCRQLYGKYSEHRPSGDEDILVRKEEFFKVKEIMEAYGFECLKPDVTEGQLDVLQEISFCEKETGFVIEVHTNVMGNGNQRLARMGDYFKTVFERKQIVDIRGVNITTMSHTDHFVYLILHAYKHFVLSGVGVRQMIDILMYQKTFEEEIDWEFTEKILNDSMAIRYLGDMQSIGEQYLGLCVSKVFTGSDSEELMKDMLEVGVFGKRDVADMLAARINLNNTDKKESKILTLIRAGFPSIEFMRIGAPYLNEKPWLLPLEWIRRWGRFLKNARNYDGNLMKDSMEKSKVRKNLLKKYGL